MRFWDSSAVLPLVIAQPRTDDVQRVASQVPAMVWWWATSVELTGAAALLRRDGVITVEMETQAIASIDELRDACHEIQASERVRLLATRLLRTHSLRSADALQLAAALIWAGTPRGDVFVTLDARLAHAAQLEGFVVAPGIQP